MTDPSTLLGPIDVLRPYVEYVVFALVIANFGTRFLAHRRHVKQAQDGAEAVSRFLPHELSNVALVLASFYYLSAHHHAGLVLSVLVLALVITDFFEFEARKVEARKDDPLERPKAALAAAMLVLAYAGYQTLFFVVEPLVKIVI